MTKNPSISSEVEAPSVGLDADFDPTEEQIAEEASADRQAEDAARAEQERQADEIFFYMGLCKVVDFCNHVYAVATGEPPLKTVPVGQYKSAKAATDTLLARLQQQEWFIRFFGSLGDFMAGWGPVIMFMGEWGMAVSGEVRDRAEARAEAEKKKAEGDARTIDGETIEPEKEQNMNGGEDE